AGTQEKLRQSSSFLTSGRRIHRFRALSPRAEIQPADRPWRPEATARQRNAPSGAVGVWYWSEGRFANRVMPGLDPGIHLLAKRMDCRVEPGNDEAGTWNEMFDSLSERLGGILDRLTRRGALTEADVDAALREVRRALLEADVALDVVRAFVDKVKSHAVGVEVIKSVTPGQMVVKIVHDQLIDILGTRGEPIDLNAPAPVPIMMVGLQGSGKTTTTAKLAKRLVEQARRKVLMASLDVRRPAAMEQLAVLGQQVNV